MDSHATVYESRCPRCDVSFPIETRTCLHCGGKTVRADRLEVFQFENSTGLDSNDSFVGGSNSGSIEMPSSGPADQDEASFFRLPEFSSRDREVEESDAEPKSIGRSIIRGLGGFIWVIVLIGYTLVRSCGGD